MLNRLRGVALALTAAGALTACGSATVVTTTGQPDKPITTPGADIVPQGCSEFVASARDMTRASGALVSDLSAYPALIARVLRASSSDDQATAQQILSTYQSSMNATNALSDQVGQLTNTLQDTARGCLAETAVTPECAAAVEDAYTLRAAYGRTLPELAKYVDLVVTAATAADNNDTPGYEALSAEMDRIRGAVKANQPSLTQAVKSSTAALERCSPTV